MSRALLRGAHRVIKYLMRFGILLTESITGVMNGGEGEIRTLVTVLALTRFRIVRLQPLGHLSAKEDLGFRPDGVLPSRKSQLWSEFATLRLRCAERVDRGWCVHVLCREIPDVFVIPRRAPQSF